MVHDTNSFRHHVLAPLTIDQFFSHHWETEPLHIGRADSQHFAHLLCLTQIEALLSTQILSYPNVQLTQSDRHIAPQEYCDENNRIVPLRALAEHAQGATLVLSHAHHHLAGLSDLCRHTEAA